MRLLDYRTLRSFALLASLKVPLQVNFTATSSPVDPKKLRVKGGRTINYDGDIYKIQEIDKSTRKNKKYVATVKNISTGKIYNVHWGDTRYDDYYVHRDKKRRENFQKRHGAIKLKNGKIAANDPRQPAYYATKANWNYMCNLVTFQISNHNNTNYLQSLGKNTY